MSLAINDSIRLPEMAAPSTPASGNVEVYSKTDKRPYSKGSDGVERRLGEWVRVNATADVTVNNSTTLVNCTGMSFSMVNNTVYEILVVVARKASGSTCVMKIGHTCGSLETSSYADGGTVVGGMSNGNFASGTTMAGASTTTAATQIRRGMVRASADGTFQALFAQNAAVVTDLIMDYTKSFILYREL